MVSIGKELTRYLDAFEHLNCPFRSYRISGLSSKVVRSECPLLADYCPWREAKNGQKQPVDVSSKLILPLRLVSCDCRVQARMLLLSIGEATSL